MKLDTKAILARADAATEGPWEVGVSDASSRLMHLARIAERLSHGERDVFPLVWLPAHPETRIGVDPNRPEHAVVVCDMGNGPKGDANGEFIAAARTDVPALCAEVERLRAALADALDAATLADDARECRRVLRRALEGGE